MKRLGFRFRLRLHSGLSFSYPSPPLPVLVPFPSSSKLHGTRDYWCESSARSFRVRLLSGQKYPYFIGGGFIDYITGGGGCEGWGPAWRESPDLSSVGRDPPIKRSIQLQSEPGPLLLGRLWGPSKTPLPKLPHLPSAPCNKAPELSQIWLCVRRHKS